MVKVNSRPNFSNKRMMLVMLALFLVSSLTVLYPSPQVARAAEQSQEVAITEESTELTGGSVSTEGISAFSPQRLCGVDERTGLTVCSALHSTYRENGATYYRIFFNYSGSFDFFQVRWSRPGKADTQVKTTSRQFTLNRAWYNTPYTFKVQGCQKGLFGSKCTPWRQLSYTIR